MNNKMISDIVKVRDKLNNILDFNNIPVKSEIDSHKLWISDRVLYVMENCSESKFYDEVMELYNLYIDMRNQFISSYYAFVVSIVNGFNGSTLNEFYDDLIQYGYIGLINAIEMYSLDYGVEFTTYAGYRIKQSVILNAKRMRYVTKVPMNAFDFYHELLRTLEELINEYGRFPTIEEVAKYMDVPLSKIGNIYNIFSGQISLDASSGIKIDGEDEIPIIDFIADGNAEVENKVFLKCLKIELNKVLEETLSEREIMILKQIFGFDGEPKTTFALAEDMGVSFQRIGQIKHRALNKLARNKKFRDMRIYLR